jgi:hypothetical protein
MLKPLVVLALIPTVLYAADNCVLEDRTVSMSAVTISERSPIRRDVVPWANNQKRCIVDFKVRIGVDWHTAFGEYVWDGAAPASESCAIAVSRAEDDVRQRVGKSQTASSKTLVCKDDPALTTLRETRVGTVGDIGQFRPHPELTEKFHHNGTQCKWFIDTNFTGKTVRTFNGIICQVSYNQWVVVDKF